jgi:hypothetical protein
VHPVRGRGAATRCAGAAGGGDQRRRHSLARNGNPFARIGADDVSQIQLAIGSSGVPETFVIDAKGTIRYQHIGEIRPDQVPLILEKLKEAEQ